MAMVADADLRPGEWSALDGMCGTCRGTGKIKGVARSTVRMEAAWRDDPHASTCPQCDGKGFGP